MYHQPPPARTRIPAATAPKSIPLPDFLSELSLALFTSSNGSALPNCGTRDSAARSSSTGAASGAIIFCNGGCSATRLVFSRSTGSSVEAGAAVRSEEHTSELQSQFHLVCRLLLEKK